MKISIFHFFLLVISKCFAQNIPPFVYDGDDRIVYEQEMDCENLSKEQMYNQALTWIADTFESSKYVIEKQAETSGSIIGSAKRSFSFPSGVTTAYYEVNFYFQLDVKDQQLTYRLADLTAIRSGNTTETPIEDIVEYAKGSKSSVGFPKDYAVALLSAGNEVIEEMLGSLADSVCPDADL
ncbi:DUF4468 domain-containing protein [Olivibacter sp. SDN3]|uniref:DUF4468 domain-containing protein n=1 Tax=Olivibacter sp. SDN3 TaxID=2764720 RepID=UPI001650DA8E|nr:DUF4468 domain-containing protein [Olivibacter sp. SDN3]QNL51088.1 DUF4468 domain-containing protein [Olivibacter sp. SDN3]